MYQFNNIQSLHKNYISKEKILSYVSEEDIFRLVFKTIPEEYVLITSPLREDDKPGCYFEYKLNTLWFVDFGNLNKFYGKPLRVIDCFTAVAVYYNIPNFYQVLKFIENTLIKGKNLPIRKKVTTNKKEITLKKVSIKVLKRDFNLLDKSYWFDRYEIHKESLIEDNVYPISKFKLINSKNDGVITKEDFMYCYDGFVSENKKIYMPFNSHKYRFVSNCTKNDIGGKGEGKNLIITKSYKDYRVLKNQSLNVRWFQNEGAYPDLNILLPLCNKYNKVTIFFDNDEPGIIAAKNLVDVINTYIPNKSEYIHLPLSYLSKGIKDPSDFIYKTNRDELNKFLNKYNLI